MRFVSKFLVVLLSLVSLAAAPQPAWSAGHNSQGMLGNAGRDASVVECPAGEVLKGFVGRRGLTIDQIQILCAPLLSDGTTGALYRYRDAYGGFGGGPVGETACGPGARIALASVALAFNNAAIAGIQITCVDRAGNVAGKPYIGGSGNMTTNCTSFIATWCNEQIGGKAEYRCPDEQFTGIRLRFDSEVRSIGFLCDVRTPAVVAAPPAPRNPVADRPAVSTRPAPHRGPPPPIDPNSITIEQRARFNGSWDTATSSNGHYRITFTMQGGGRSFPRSLPIPVSGQFINTDGSNEYDGVLQGTIKPNSLRLEYSYTQTNGATGTGAFVLSQDGARLTGSGKTSDGQSFTWNGTPIR